MSTYTVDVDVPSEVGATIHLAVPSVHQQCKWPWAECTDPSCTVESPGTDIPPPVLAALVQKKCETCGGTGTVTTFDDAGWAHQDYSTCPACAGSGFDLLDLMREPVPIDGTDPSEPRNDLPGWDEWDPDDGPFVVSLGRFQVEELLPVVGDDESAPEGCTAFVFKDSHGAWVLFRANQPVEYLPENITPKPGGYVATLTLVVAP